MEPAPNIEDFRNVLDYFDARDRFQWQKQERRRQKIEKVLNVVFGLLGFILLLACLVGGIIGQLQIIGFLQRAFE